MRRDGVFRSVPSAATQEAADKVVAQFGAWSAMVALGGGELCQAFFDTQEAASAALEAAMQSTGKAPAKGLKNGGGVPGFVAAGAGSGQAAAQRTVSPPASGAATKAEGTPEPGAFEQKQQQQQQRQGQQPEQQQQQKQQQKQQQGGKQQQQQQQQPPPSREQTPGDVVQGVQKEAPPQKQQQQQQK